MNFFPFFEKRRNSTFLHFCSCKLHYNPRCGHLLQPQFPLTSEPWSIIWGMIGHELYLHFSVSANYLKYHESVSHFSLLMNKRWIYIIAQVGIILCTENFTKKPWFKIFLSLTDINFSFLITPSSYKILLCLICISKERVA